jgi:carboxymethylenebutenolidase
VGIIKQKRSDCEIYVYKGAGHGFHCDERGSYNADASKIAWERTTAFLKKHMGGK